MNTNYGPLSIQLWSTRGPDPLEDQLSELAAMGYRDVQPYHDQYDDVPLLQAALDRFGLTSISGHFALSMFDGDALPVIEAARMLRMKLVVAPWLDPADRPGDADGWRRLHVRLQRMKSVVEDAGLAFAWHNHDFEFQLLPCGSYGIQYLLDEDIDLAADLAWISVGGQDPALWLRRYAGRVPVIHVKDVAPSGQNIDQQGFADVGDGILDWTELWSVANDLRIPLRIAEHDCPSDWRRFARTSANTIRRLSANN